MASLFTMPRQIVLQADGTPYANAKAFFYRAGTTTDQTVYQDAARSTPHAQPVEASDGGYFQPIYLDPEAAADYRIILKTSADALIPNGDIDDIPRLPMSQADIGLSLYPITDAEIAAGVSSVNYAIPSHEAVGYAIVDRYGTNTIPGTTDMSDALQSAVDVALTVYGGGKYGIPVRFMANAYKIVTPPTYGSATSDMKSLDIGGAGTGTQIINAAASSHPTFNFSNVSGFYLHDLLLTGNTANLNDGVLVYGATAGTYRWRIERVVSMMPGRGIVLRDTNTGVIRDFKHWPDSGDDLPTVAQSVTTTDIDHGIYMTGSFIHDVSIYDPDCFPRGTFKANACGIYCDAAGPNHGIRIIGGMVQGNSGNARHGVYLKNCNSAKILGTYHESSQIRLNTCTGVTIDSTNNGGVEGIIALETNSVGNVIIGCNAASLSIDDASCIKNTIIGGELAAISDAAKPNNRYIQQRSATGYQGGDRGGRPWATITYSASMTPDMDDGDRFNIVPNNGTAFTVNEPDNPIDGDQVMIKIRNDTGSSLGALTWGADYKAASTTQPSNGFSIIRTFTHDKSYGSGVLWIQTGADVTVAN